MKNFLKRYWITILLSLLVGVSAAIWTHYIQSSPQVELPMQAGRFITLDKLKLSLYITRIVNGENKVTVCFVQQRPIDFIFFENCVWIDSIMEVMDVNKGRITDTYIYSRVME